MRDPNSIPDRGDPDRDPTIVHSNIPPPLECWEHESVMCNVECTCGVLMIVCEQVGAVDVMCECEGLWAVSVLCSVLFCSVLFCSVLFCSVLFIPSRVRPFLVVVYDHTSVVYDHAL